MPDSPALPTARSQMSTDCTLKAAQQPPRRPSNISNSSNIHDTTTFDPSSPTDRELARLAGIRIDTPTPFPRLLLQPHITIQLDRGRFANDAQLEERTKDVLQRRHKNTLLIRPTDLTSPAAAPDEAAWVARRKQARIYRAAHPISIASTRGAFAASIAGPQQPVQLPPGFLATANRTLSTAEAFHLLAQNSRPFDDNNDSRHLLPLFVYGHWMFAPQLAAAALGRGAANQPPTPDAAAQWAQRMVPAAVQRDAATERGEGAWHRYCIRGRAPTPALLQRASPRLLYYLRDAGEQPPVDGRLVLGVTRAQWAALDAFLDVGRDEKVWGKREVLVGVRVEDGSLARVRAVAYVWAGDPMDLHVFKVDKKWTPELYVEWHGRVRREMAEAPEAPEADAVSGAQ